MKQKVSRKLQRLTALIFIDFILDFSGKLLREAYYVTIIAITGALIEC